ncbi:MAG: hypothetical protein A2Y14_03015 [Verrucomicrobia bacterium GWF2_51_19]|nr:MAG: hypothetical protein A2Y14_03015 [Verrucomicrobia bacterium GWF2_51_19]
MDALIQPHCRKSLTLKDRLFLQTIHGRSIPEQTLDEWLDHERTLHVLLDSPEIFDISSSLYFYVLSRQLLMKRDIDDRDLADYMASLLCQGMFSRYFLDFSGGSLHFYSFDVLDRIERATNAYEHFSLGVQLGNISLLLTGLFPDFLEQRAERNGAPRCSYYENIGRAQFYAAGEHPLAKRHGLSQIFANLAENFDATKETITYISKNVCFLGEDFWAYQKFLS